MNKEWNEQQIEAIKEKQKNVLLVAGAGTGKTSVLVEKAKKQIKEMKKEEKLLILSFTNEAVEEIKERLNLKNDKNVWITTFHSLGMKMLKMLKEKVGSFIGPEDQEYLIHKIKEEKDITLRTEHIIEIINLIKIDSKRLERKEIIKKRFNTEEKEYEFEIVYKEYEKKIKEEKNFDMSELISRPIYLSKNNEKVKFFFENIFDYIYVDEFQDINDKQHELLMLISKNVKQLFAVGDDHQSIYGFQGSNVENIINFENNFKDSKVLKMTTNYRSTQEILKAANNLISFNEKSIKKELKTNNEVGEGITILTANNRQKEAERIVIEIKKLIKEKKVKRKDIAVIFRSNNEKTILERSLRDLEGGYREEVLRNSYFVETRIKALIALINLKEELFWSDIEDYTSLTKNGNGVIMTNELKNKEKLGFNLVDSLEEIIKEKKFRLTNNHLNKLRRKINELKEISESKRKMTTKEYHKMIVNKINIYGNGLYKINKLESFAKEIEKDYLYAKLKEIEEKIKEKTTLEELKVLYKQIEKIDKGNVNLISAHASKGKEFEVVFITGANEKNFPISYAKTSEQIEEERRLFFVAMTRAKKKLYISNIQKRRNRNHKKEAEEIEVEKSRFLSEI